MTRKVAPDDSEKFIKSSVEDPALVKRRRAQITAAAIKVFAELGFHRATIRDVAKLADISVGLVYQYYGDKEDLLFSALFEIVRNYNRVIPPALESVAHPIDRFVAAVRAYCSANNQSPEATLLAYRETGSLSRANRKVIKQLEIDTNELIAQCVRDCIKAGVFQNIDVKLFTTQIMMFSHTWALKAWYLQDEYSLDDYIDGGLKILLSGVLTPKGMRRFEALRA